VEDAARTIGTGHIFTGLGHEIAAAARGAIEEFYVIVKQLVTLYKTGDIREVESRRQEWCKSPLRVPQQRWLIRSKVCRAGAERDEVACHMGHTSGDAVQALDDTEHRYSGYYASRTHACIDKQPRRLSDSQAATFPSMHSLTDDTHSGEHGEWKYLLVLPVRKGDDFCSTHSVRRSGHQSEGSCTLTGSQKMSLSCLFAF
jgi:hypothetical protein